MSEPRITIAILEDVTEQLSPTSSVRGNITLCSVGEAFQLYFTLLENSSKSWVVNAMIDPSSLESNNWVAGQQFLINILSVEFFTLSSDPLRFIISPKGKENREFIINQSHGTNFTEFLEQIIIHGIALPTAKLNLSLEVYSHTYKSLFPFHPLHLSITYDSHIENLFNNITEFASNVIMQYEAMNAIPSDLLVAIASFAVSDGQRAINRIIVPKYKRLTADDLKTLYDSEGRFLDFELLKKRISNSGLDSNCLPELLPFLTGIYQPHSTFAEREEIKKDLIKQYKMLQVQYNQMSKEQKENNNLFFPLSIVIRNDVHRTDRELKAFRNDKGEGLKILSELLNCYLLYRPDVSYLQGMNDLIVPFLHAYIPDWDENGTPLCDNLVDKLAMVFWTYDGMINSLGHDYFLPNLTKMCRTVTNTAVKVIKKFSPITYLFFKLSGNTDLVFTYSEYVLIYKRSFSDIWYLWLGMLCMENPKHALYLLTAAVIIKIFPGIAALPEWSMATMMGSYQANLSNVKTSDVIPLMLYLERFEKTDIYEEVDKTEIQPFNSTRFFKGGILPSN
ncbi:hypothetical protein TVAG_050330 [Trichomonas vaginalis G3]|uniref:Rab-GAP TBC domain-containing protein n=1 Tax=Trichomonas vaginalis (strain ATCC PRA-98 / G3) TaxID=412133 RepID=A2EJG1_TRIV3|nr:regulation of vesicle fusion [Trichomonas vaginalis G3]EAY07218.1 hypothetical protein TVAG_050330 [Trichomonas vaginalis G3]KAI5533906.1 regulation of vesicle fusion [Trichomonas vaginalis G3]|eukprot:XP_001319441.1 hypothetical protein [Trichomonas vaginalis G3]